MIKDKKYNLIYSNLTIKLVNLASIKRLVSGCIGLRNIHGLKKDVGEDEMIIYALRMYKRSIERRIKNKSKRRKNVGFE